MIIQDNLYTTTHNLADTHLSLAVEAYLNSKVKRSYNKLPVSAILHSYFGLGSAVNFLGYEIFFNEDSSRYVPINQRDIPLQKMLKGWNTALPCLEKIEFILSRHSLTLPPKLKNQFLELNNLRNWLTHGFTYKTTMLMEPKEGEENTFNVIDTEDDVDWKKKFPNNKFNSIHTLSSQDAEKVLRIVLEIIILLSTACSQPFSIIVVREKLKFYMLFKETKIDDILLP